jgi:hypothetical protein
VTDLETSGYAAAAIGLSAQQCDHIAASLAPPAAGHGISRNLLGHPTISQVLNHRAFGEYIWSIVGRELVAVNATLFAHTEWHQDRFVAVRERMAVRGYDTWRTRSGTVRVEAPAEVLAQMLAVRIHIGEQTRFRVIPGSHRHGKLSAAAMEKLIATSTFTEVDANRGDILLMRPLLVHASAAPQQRVIHIELAPAEAISPLQWENAVPLRRAAGSGERQAVKVAADALHGNRSRAGVNAVRQQDHDPLAFPVDPDRRTGESHVPVRAGGEHRRRR